MASAPFDDEGVATRDRELVADGISRATFFSSYSARKLGLETTGNAEGLTIFSSRQPSPAVPTPCCRGSARAFGDRIMGQGVNM